MTPLSLLIILVLAVVVLVLLLVKFKMHPVLGLFLTAILVGITTNQGLYNTLSTICAGFGGTLTSIGIPILAGCIIAMGMQDTGAVIAIANGFLKLFRGKRMELSVALTAYIMSIPVFGDVTMILCAPIANVLAKRTKTSMSTMAAWLVTGQFLTHGRHSGRYPRPRRQPRRRDRLGPDPVFHRVLHRLLRPEQVGLQGIHRAPSGLRGRH